MVSTSDIDIFSCFTPQVQGTTLNLDPGATSSVEVWLGTGGDQALSVTLEVRASGEPVGGRTAFVPIDTLDFPAVVNVSFRVPDRPGEELALEVVATNVEEASTFNAPTVKRTSKPVRTSDCGCGHGGRAPVLERDPSSLLRV